MTKGAQRGTCSFCIVFKCSPVPSISPPFSISHYHPCGNLQPNPNPAEGNHALRMAEHRNIILQHISALIIVWFEVLAGVKMVWGVMIAKSL